ncbi:FecR family protein [Chitinophaga polysaccharea]|uniref:FecR family protein n=1 Tax=Chitinophaga polysaccharea TaxID=1293035 RepID=A0A561Q5N4_9BACT|nr:FecR family protein [Chitinophaga polysaccharea]
MGGNLFSGALVYKRPFHVNHDQLVQLAQRIADGTATTADISLYNELLSKVDAGEDWDEAELGDRTATEKLLRRRIYQHAGIRRNMLWSMVVKTSVAAAIAALMVFTGMKLWKAGSQQKDGDKLMAGKAMVPGSNKAVLTLANGETVVLDSAGNRVMQQGSATIHLRNGEVVYNNTAAQQQAFNVLTTPAGGQYQLVLPDGTKVWLNAASSLRFPAGFDGKERRVELSGEAYFEVAQDTKMPFVVQSGDKQVQVLGTHFNLMAYQEEPSTDVTLLEGAVKVIHRTDTALLKPGQQAKLVDTRRIQLVLHADTEKIIAWKNGFFSLNGEGTEVVMRQLARWYNAEIVYAGKIPDLKFEGSIKRSYELADVLAILEESGIHFKIEGRKIIVLPA